MTPLRALTFSLLIFFAAAHTFPNMRPVFVKTQTQSCSGSLFQSVRAHACDGLLGLRFISCNGLVSSLVIRPFCRCECEQHANSVTPQSTPTPTPPTPTPTPTPTPPTPTTQPPATPTPTTQPPATPTPTTQPPATTPTPTQPAQPTPTPIPNIISQFSQIDDISISSGTMDIAIIPPTSSSGLSVTLSVLSGPAVFLAGTNTLRVSPPTPWVDYVVIVASQAGDAGSGIPAATPVTASILVTRGALRYVAPTGTAGAADSTSAGQSPSTPYATADYAAKKSSAGTVIVLLPGLYTNPGYNSSDDGTGDIWKVGATIKISSWVCTEVQPCYLMARKRGDVVVRGDADFIVQVRTSSFVTVANLVCEGDTERIPLARAKQWQFAYKETDASGNPVGDILWRVNSTLSDAEVEALYSTPGSLPKLSTVFTPSRFRTVGLLVQSSDNIEVTNCTISFAPGVGLRFQSSDKFSAYGNIVYECSRRSPVGNHGFVMHSIVDSAGQTGIRNRVVGNLVYNNYNEIYSWSELKTFVNPYIDEGKGITIQKSPITAGSARTLIANNIAFGNGFSGVHLNEADNVDIVANTIVNNHRSGSGKNTGISISDGKDNTIFNNIVVSTNTFGGKALNLVGTDITTTTIGSNVVVGDVITSDVPVDATNLFQDPQFQGWATTDTEMPPTGVDFHLQSTSPARGNGISLQPYNIELDFDGVFRTATPDVGALQFAN